MSDVNKGRVVDLGSVKPKMHATSRYIGSHTRDPGADTVPIEEGSPRQLLNAALTRELAREDPLILRAQQTRIMEAWGRINAREMAGFFGACRKIQTAHICDFPAMFWEIALYKGKGDNGKAQADGNKLVRFGVPLDDIPEIVAHMIDLYKRGCIRYGQTMRPIGEASTNVSGYDDGNPTIKKK